MANLSLPTTFYPPLDNNTQQIRLLSFKDDGNFALEVFDLADRPDYIALSYVWGSPDEVDEIIVNGRSFSIHQNLFLALRAIGWHLRNFAEGQGKNEKSKLRVSGRGMEVETEIPEVQNAQSAKDEDVALSPGRWKYFWIDAICINQDDIPERNSQVQRMGDLYTNASFVMVWLGPDVDESLAHIRICISKNAAVRFRYKDNTFGRPNVEVMV
ncbi:putative Heterokaryon incompatibility protein 6, OR allele [Glarea lozoyensis 74030]|uniref:Putative Heterokaryon incompatibility protein 6, OR allele n=1 Tax=Glarea lozoyensis (strain ATCC 74030 / MF5533) TaxID=1104152 RepID=H0EWU6_GLAL7|nr:putative Heterokaryon incompatibility protein 6, OR allele [Glarea lozoyensis 74030]